jgi:short-subunit dehydrogenase
MRKHKEGWILNTASTAGFLPGPLQATYFATKAFVISFTKALRQELKGSGIHISALCPGPVKTEFEKVAGMDGSDMFAKGASADSTALKGYKGLTNGKLIIFDQIGFKILIKYLLPFTPNSLLSKIIEKMQTI